MDSTRGVLAPLQGIPKDLPYGGHEQHVSFPEDKKTKQRRDHMADPLSEDRANSPIKRHSYTTKRGLRIS